MYLVATQTFRGPVTTVTTQATVRFCSHCTTQMATVPRSWRCTKTTETPSTATTVTTAPYLVAVMICTFETTPTTTPAHTPTWATPTMLRTAVQMAEVAAPCWREAIIRLQYQISRFSTKLLRS